MLHSLLRRVVACSFLARKSRVFGAKLGIVSWNGAYAGKAGSEGKLGIVGPDPAGFRPGGYMVFCEFSVMAMG